MDQLSQDIDSPEEPEGWRILAAALAAGRTHAQAAEAAGVSSKTVQRRLGIPAFRRLVADIRRERVDTLTGRLLELADASLEVFAAAVEDDHPQIRLQGAKAILDYTRRYYRDETCAREVAERMTAIEVKVGLREEPDQPEGAVGTER